MPFPEEFKDIKKRVYLVGLFNDVDISKRKKFFGLGKFPPRATLATGGCSNEVGFQNFINLVKPQVAAVQSGVMDETNWFFRIGDPDGQADDRYRANLLVGFPGENIFGSVQTELDNLGSLLNRVVNEYFNNFALYLHGLKGNTRGPDLGGWANQNWLPEGLLALFIEGIADDWLFSGHRPPAVADKVGSGIDGFQIWSETFRGIVTSSDLVGYLESWASDRLKEELNLLRSANPQLAESAKKELDAKTAFARDVGAIQKLAQICGSKTLQKLLVFWPYEFILEDARKAWKKVTDQKKDIPNYSDRGPYDALDFLLATSWVNKCELNQVKSKDFDQATLEKLANLVKLASVQAPDLAKPIERDSYEVRRRQVENHIEGWRRLYECENLDELDEASTKEIQDLLDCNQKKMDRWQEVIETAKAYQLLWSTGSDATSIARNRELGKKSAITFAKAAVKPAFDALFQTPAFDPSYLPEIYENEFIQLYQDCLLVGDAEDVTAVRKAGGQYKLAYQPAEGVAWIADTEAAKRAGYRFDTSLQGNKTVLEQAKKQEIKRKVALVSPAIRYFAYGVNRRIPNNPGGSAYVYLLRYDQNLSGTAQATAGRLTAFREVMCEGIRGDVVAAVRKIIDAHNQSCNTSGFTIKAVDVRFVKTDTPRQASPGYKLPFNPTTTESDLACVDEKATRKLITDELSNIVKNESVRFNQAQENLKVAKMSHDKAEHEKQKKEEELSQARDKLTSLLQHEAATPEDANNKQQREQQEQKAKATENDLNVSLKVLENAKKNLIQAEQAAKPVPITFAIDFTIDNEVELAVADWASKHFQEAWKTILTTVSNQPTNEDLKRQLRKLLLTEFLLIGQQNLNADKDQWLDLKLLLDLVGSGTIQEFLKKHSLTTYSDRLDGVYELAGRFNELSRLASSSLDTMRLLVSELHGMKCLLDGCGQDKQIVIFNGTAEEYLEVAQEENLEDSIPTADRPRTPYRFLELTAGGGSPSESFFAPACVYFTTLAFPADSPLQKKHLAGALSAIPLRKHDGRDYAMAMPPMVMDLGTLTGPTPGEWWKADWGGENPKNPLSEVPLHFIGPSPWLRGPDVSVGLPGVNRFTTVLPAGYLLLLRLLQDCQIAFPSEGSAIASTSKAKAMAPDVPFIFNISLNSRAYLKNLEDAFRIIDGKTSFIITVNLYLALLDALIKNWDTLNGVNQNAFLTLNEPPPDGVAKSLWYHLAFDSVNQFPNNAQTNRRNEPAYLLDDTKQWYNLWWSPKMMRINSGKMQIELEPMKSFDMVSGNERRGYTIPSNFTGWLMSVLRRY